jgi:hypothetical protein
MDEVENFFFANFQILGPLGCQGWVVIPQNVKKVKITAPYCVATGKGTISSRRENILLYRTSQGRTLSNVISESPFA